jgi:hypothetical protein
MTRRDYLTGIMGASAAAVLPRSLRAQNAESAIPPQGIGHNIRHLSYSDQGGRPDGVQIMMNGDYLYVGHMFNDGFTVMDARDPRNLRPLNFIPAAQNTRTHHLQTAGDYMLLANGASIVRMQSYDNSRDYFENTLADTIDRSQSFRAGLSVFDIAANPAEPREIAYLEMPGIGINRLWWTGQRYAYIATHLDGFTDTTLVIVDLQDITRPEIVSHWWLPGMHRAGGEEPTNPPGKRYALHHMIVAGDRGYGAWRDGGFTIHDISDASNPRLLSHINWSPPYPGGTHTPLPLPGRELCVVVDESNADYCEKGMFYTWVVDVREDENPVPIATFPTPHEPATIDFCSMGNFGPHNVHENRPESFVSEETIFATYHNAGLRVFDIRNQYQPEEIAWWVPPMPERMVDPRPNIVRNALTCDCYVTPDGLVYVSDWNAGLHVLEYLG